MVFRKRNVERKLNLFALREPVKAERVQSLLCLVDPSQVSVDQMCNSLELIFKDDKPEFHFVYYLKRKRKDSTHFSPQFNRYHLHWDGDLLHPSLPELVSRKFDIMFNYFKKCDLTLRAISSSVDAGFRVGFSSVDERLNDLILASDVFQPDQFVKEFPKYYSKISTHATN